MSRTLLLINPKFLKNKKIISKHYNHNFSMRRNEKINIHLNAKKDSSLAYLSDIFIC